MALGDAETAAQQSRNQMSCLEIGFAVRCAAMALPRRERAGLITGCAPGSVFDLCLLHSVSIELFWI